MKNINPRLLTVLGIILFGALLRLLPHWPNFTPIAAIAMFGGAYMNKKSLAFAVPLAAMFVSDLLLGFHSYMWAVYVSFALVVVIGLLLRERVKTGTVLVGSLASSVPFFLITNFAVWLGSPFYPQTLSGLTQCYVAALPFLNNGLLGDLFYNAIFFGTFYFAVRRFPTLAYVKK